MPAPTVNGSQPGYREVIKDDESLATFLRQMAKFDRLFCDAMASGIDCNLRLEVRCNQNELIHARVTTDHCDRPVGVEKRIEAAKR